MHVAQHPANKPTAVLIAQIDRNENKPKIVSIILQRSGKIFVQAQTAVTA